jgi:hypothetical protein
LLDCGKECSFTKLVEICTCLKLRTKRHLSTSMACVAAYIDKEESIEHLRPTITTSSTYTCTQLHHTSKDCQPGRHSAAPNKSSITSKKRTTRQEQARAKPTPPQGAAHPEAPASNHRPARQRVRRAKHTTADAEHGNGNRRTNPTRATDKVATRAQKAAREEATRTEKGNAAQRQAPGQREPQPAPQQRHLSKALHSLHTSQQHNKSAQHQHCSRTTRNNHQKREAAAAQSHLVHVPQTASKCRLPQPRNMPLTGHPSPRHSRETAP